MAYQKSTMRYLKLLLIIGFFVPWPHYASVAFSQTHMGSVVAITDGDTFTLLTADKEQKKIRLSEVDTPEKGQPYGEKSRQVLSDLIFNKQVSAEQTNIDRYGRIVARVYQEQTDVNAEMIRQGAAWVYRQYASDQKLFDLEAEAKASGRGLWSLPETQRVYPHRVPPWQWRKTAKQASEPVKITTTTEEMYDCGVKHYCKEMTSCEEAEYYLKYCGLSRLDADGDGVPCESVCQ